LGAASGAWISAWSEPAKCPAYWSLAPRGSTSSTRLADVAERHGNTTMRDLSVAPSSQSCLLPGQQIPDLHMGSTNPGPHGLPLVLRRPRHVLR